MTIEMERDGCGVICHEKASANKDTPAVTFKVLVRLIRLTNGWNMC